MRVSSLGRYQVADLIGGHQCRVYRARREGGPWIALKVLPRDADAERRERLLAEARICSRVAHPNLVRMLDVGEEDGCLYLAMELLEGGTLRDVLRQGPLNAAEALRIAREAGSALACLHAHGVIHRDVKPENIFLQHSGPVKVIDFGLAKVEGLDLTAAGFTLGTPYYMAPEQVRGERPTARIDIHAFGVMLFEMLSGERPFQGGSAIQVFDAILQDQPDLSRLQRPGVTPAVVEIVRRCTEKAASDRPADMSTVVAALSQ